MLTIDIRRWLPKFILGDKNGYAVAKAIEAGLQRMNDAVLQGFKLIADYDSMPEWRLDELAWEYDLLYDYSADIETKRAWVAGALPSYRLHGTPGGVVRYLNAVYDGVRVEEWFEYGGEPYHFRVKIADTYSEETLAWVRKSIEVAQNLRSVLDAVIFEGESADTTAYALAAAAAMEGSAGAVAIGEVPVEETPVDEDYTTPIMFRD